MTKLVCLEFLSIAYGILFSFRTIRNNIEVYANYSKVANLYHFPKLSIYARLVISSPGIQPQTMTSHILRLSAVLSAR